MASTNKAGNRVVYFVVVIVFFALMLTITACSDGASSSTWRRSVGLQERTSDGSFSISLRSATSGTRNRTYTLTNEELSSISVSSSSANGEIILIVSQDGARDGTEIRTDVSNFDGEISAGGLNAGRIRFTLIFDDVQDSSTVISWR